MQEEKKYKIVAPLSSSIIGKDLMTEEELRNYIKQIALKEDGYSSETWIIKAEKDPIEDLIQWLTSSGYIITISK